MDVKRRILIQAAQTKENEIIPIWDDRLIFDDNEYYGKRIILKDSPSEEQLKHIECVFDLKTKKIEKPIILDFKRDSNSLDFKKDEIVLFEKSHKCLIETKISGIEHIEYDTHIKLGSKLDTYWKELFDDVKFENDILYCIKEWRPVYVLASGHKTEWAHQLYKKYKK